jgi:hypothetical protein
VKKKRCIEFEKNVVVKLMLKMNEIWKLLKFEEIYETLREALRMKKLSRAFET